MTATSADGPILIAYDGSECSKAAIEQAGASVIVLGSHGRSGVGYAVMGSVATAVAHHAKVPVLITREAKD